MGRRDLFCVLRFFGGLGYLLCACPVPKSDFTGDPAVLTSLRVQTQASQKFRVVNVGCFTDT